MRNIGLENLICIANFGNVANPIGAVSYATSILFGVFGIGGEFKDRMNKEIEKDEAKREINRLCAESNIPAYKNTRELHQHFKEQMIEYESQRNLCEIIYAIKNTDERNELINNKKKINQLYQMVHNDVANKLEFSNMPKSIPFTKKLWDTIKPWGKEEAREFDNRTIDQIVKYDPNKRTKNKKRRFGRFHPSSTPSTNKIQTAKSR